MKNEESKNKDERIAILVYGPESSGTRLLTRLFIAAGCDGDGTHGQRFDSEIPDKDGYIVWRRSFPHAQRWPDIELMVNKLLDKNYKVFVYVTTRDWISMYKSQIKNGYAQNMNMAFQNAQNAYTIIFSKLNKMGIRCIMFSYEAMVQRPEAYIGFMLGTVGLDMSKDFEEIRDENEKYY